MEFRNGARDGNLQSMKDLLQRGANLNGENKIGQRAVHNAALGGQVEVLQWLLEKGAEINTTTKSGDSPLHCASGAAHSKVVELLLKNGVDVDIKNNSGVTASEAATDEAVKQVFKSVPPTPKRELSKPATPQASVVSVPSKQTPTENKVNISNSSSALSTSTTNLLSPPNTPTKESANNSIVQSPVVQSSSNNFNNPSYGNGYHRTSVETLDDLRGSSTTDKLLLLLERQTLEMKLLRCEVQEMREQLNTIANSSSNNVPPTLNVRIGTKTAIYRLENYQ